MPFARSGAGGGGDGATPRSATATPRRTVLLSTPRRSTIADAYTTEQDLRIAARVAVDAETADARAEPFAPAVLRSQPVADVWGAGRRGRIELAPRPALRPMSALLLPLSAAAATPPRSPSKQPGDGRPDGERGSAAAAPAGKQAAGKQAAALRRPSADVRKGRVSLRAAPLQL